jgi:hypothetical protein
MGGRLKLHFQAAHLREVEAARSHSGQTIIAKKQNGGARWITVDDFAAIPASVPLEPGFTRDVSNVGHFGTGDLEITLTKPEDLDRAMPLIKRSYEDS